MATYDIAALKKGGFMKQKQKESSLFVSALSAVR